MGVKNKSSRKESKYNTKLIKVAVGAVISTVLFFSLLAVFAVLSLKSDFSASLYLPAGLLSGAVSAFMGGFICVRPIMEKGALFGLISGVVQAVVCSAVLFALNGGAAGNGLFILFGIISAFSVLGGIAAVNLKIKKKY